MGKRRTGPTEVSAPRLWRAVDFLSAEDNFPGRSYFEFRNFFESRIPGGAPAGQTRAAPACPAAVTAALTSRF